MIASAGDADPAQEGFWWLGRPGGQGLARRRPPNGGGRIEPAEPGPPAAPMLGKWLGRVLGMLGKG